MSLTATKLLLSCIIVLISGGQRVQTYPADPPSFCGDTTIECYLRRQNNNPTLIIKNNYTKVYMGGNVIKELPANVFHDLPNLKLLYISGNEVTSIDPVAFSGLSLLTSLDLSYNAIEELPANVFQDLSSLEVLKIDHNQLTSINAAAFHGLFQLTDLFLNYNNLQTLPDTVFNDLTQLSTLFVSDNSLTSFPVQSLAKAVKGRKMRHLFMQYNSLLACALKDEILLEIDVPGDFRFSNRCL